ncbi:protein mono-ADP-ribosyltransferase PARP14-like isoform X2 [Ambystoma mexicanum]|uniref:protein mono-ADP-ribosyltransferase PARP14-like isoform X2 n=1 Tax=Ambystoma mexicanum TaxID=8296 RepID=UPI0037E76176
MGEDGYPYPILVRGGWGKLLCPQALKKNLLCYFQSQERSGGGECHITDSDHVDGQLLVHFAEKEVRQRVLANVHEVDFAENGKILLEVQLPTATGEQSAGGASLGDRAPMSAGEPQAQENAASEQQALSEVLDSIWIPDCGDAIDEDILEMYFENAKRSGGGPIKSLQRNRQGIQITFENTEDAQEVLRHKIHSVQNILLQVQPCQDSCIVKAQPPTFMSSSVVLENVPDNMTPDMLVMLIENASDLFEEDFIVERILELNVAVITLRSSDGVLDFIKRFAKSTRVKSHCITARQLECTKSIKAENLPPTVSIDFLMIYFESSKHGGGRVAEVEPLPEENSAIVTFYDQKVINTVLAKQHTMKEKAISVYPYYSSLDTVLYGKDRPVLKLPEAIRLTVNPYIWKYLQKDQNRMQDVNNEMVDSYCELIWPQLVTPCTEVILAPMASLSKQRKIFAKTWNEQVTTKFISIMSKYKAAEYTVNPMVWEAMQEKVKSVMEVGVLVLHNGAKGKVGLVGTLESVVKMEDQFTEILEQTNKELERKTQSRTEHMQISPSVYAILCSDNLNEAIHKAFPEMIVSYDASLNWVNLFGLPTEVYGAKSIILERERTLKQKTLNVSPHILHFIQKVNNEELSYFLFTSKEISALCKTEGNVVLLMGNSQNAIETAEQQIKQELLCKCVALEDNTVTRMKEWHTLKNNLMDVFNSQMTTVLIEGDETQVAIVGYSGVVTEVYDQVLNFIDENTKIELSIPLMYKVVAKFLEEEKNQMLLEIEKKNIQMDLNCLNKRKQISLSGPRRDVLDMADRVQQVLSSLHSKVLTVNKPGANKFLQKLDETWIITVKQKFKCCVNWMKDGEEFEEECKVESGIPCYCVKLPSGLVVSVYKDDLCKHPVDVVVNASNEHLRHIGGLALALLNAAGPQLQTDSDTFVQKNGKLKPGQIAVTSAWNLPCRHVVHAVGPMWQDSTRENSEFLLKKIIKESLGFTESKNYSSIAIPAISSGIFGFPLDLCVDCLVVALKEHLETHPGKSSLQQIHFVDSNQKTVTAFTGALKKHFGNCCQLQPMRKAMSNTECKESIQGNQKDIQILKTNGLTVILEKGNIQDAKTDVIVSSTAEDLDLGKGAVSKALLQKAGPELQQSIREAALPATFDIGSVLPTDGFHLNCQKIFHVNTPNWEPNGSSVAIFKDLIKNCLKLTEEMHLKSITFPAIGTGNLGFPKPAVAESMFAQVIESSQKNNFQSLHEVHIMLHPSDTDNFTAFSCELEKIFCGISLYKKETPKAVANVSPSESTAKSSGSIGEISTPAPGVYEMQIGSITLQVKSGDITKESADVIVNSTNQKFNLKSGVSKAILEAAGRFVETECEVKGAMPNDGYIITTHGDLACKKIIHTTGHSDLKGLKITVQNVLHACERLQCTSVAFPALGTGQAGVNPLLVAEIMMDELVEFASQTNASHVKKITIIIFQKQMLELFHSCMKKIHCTNQKEQKSQSSKMTADLSSAKQPVGEEITDLIFEDKIEPVVFQICGENQKSVDEAASWIEELLLREHCVNVISDEWIAEFDKPEMQKLTALQSELQIRIKVDCKQKDSSVEVSGLARDVMRACIEIQEMIKKMSKEFGEKRHAELISNIVQWHYVEGSNTFAFDKMANVKIEDAFVRKEKTVEIQDALRTYKVNFSKESATYDSNKVKIKRISKTEAHDIPKHWDKMGANTVKLVQLLPKSKEYQDVQVLFMKTCRLAIQKIERVQNLFLWKNYMIKKMSIDQKNGSQTNEQQLFHGTAHSYVSTINKNGFNRSFAGLNAASFGNGTYFAVNAKYSSHDTYSKPDAFGMKYMYLARVLTGLFCFGRQGIITPPAKSVQDPTDLYDSVTDDVANPAMFVIFNDVQAYPEYLISFK